MSKTPARRIAKALAEIDDAFWAACDSAGGPVDPATLGAPDGLLDDAHDAALSVEALAIERGITWAEARELV
jgi:hypothetical protein